ncbi:uncharacterized protein OCT59_004405 [Rhizophagus irregularis]|uniref:Uncharacterized protein n=1 Tax=Rhizophagus irregularis (strain DAOM 181602 / DAOM 197198 / MUCL 43194) TaxID=747089 RepID=A0A2P4Q888_RHIID|nr:hypothetical protein GLOIN_2v1772018 [Rhizophagus irregularis DAOM 181602=DAOM 197198]POG73844.1 hypothetical protein GLOIN_2v1772018 [Rhizophagus irregularis DAOM 181602=DAOM 197198]UZO12897.1 hypothetical protein OCT59_004405 [Rhizophagus irregularis]|eukprot:XP_025180710.1 hypothetical protein GLOIN_2v1772018 [Rhizophagus irregularis DAOM 181602=DAOM 197198]
MSTGKCQILSNDDDKKIFGVAPEVLRGGEYTQQFIQVDLDFENLPEPKNADNDDLEYSDSLRMDFIKFDINSKDERN